MNHQIKRENRNEFLKKSHKRKWSFENLINYDEKIFLRLNMKSEVKQTFDLVIENWLTKKKQLKTKCN